MDGRVSGTNTTTWNRKTTKWSLHRHISQRESPICASRSRSWPLMVAQRVLQRGCRHSSAPATPQNYELGRQGELEGVDGSRTVPQWSPSAVVARVWVPPLAMACQCGASLPVCLVHCASTPAQLTKTSINQGYWDSRWIAKWVCSRLAASQARATMPIGIRKRGTSLDFGKMGGCAGFHLSRRRMRRTGRRNSSDDRSTV